jgi:hypothetical protein
VSLPAAGAAAGGVAVAGPEGIAAMLTSAPTTLLTMPLTQPALALASAESSNICTVTITGLRKRQLAASNSNTRAAMAHLY